MLEVTAIQKKSEDLFQFTCTDVCYSSTHKHCQIGAKVVAAQQDIRAIILGFFWWKLNDVSWTKSSGSLFTDLRLFKVDFNISTISENA